jgi:hypothetical protein
VKDHFSRHAEDYAKYRPVYPVALFDFILTHTTNRERLWDCATGNGQTAEVLADHFREVCATDISQEQLDHAPPVANITWSRQPAERTDFPDNYFDLITVSQALHWLHFDDFYKEATRTGRTGSHIAVWMYDLLKISPDIDNIILSLYAGTLKDYWDAERKHVDAHYTTIPFPFEEINCAPFNMEYEWTLPELAGYLNTWSALRKFVDRHKHNPVDALTEKIRPAWASEKMRVRFPVYLRMGKILK